MEGSEGDGWTTAIAGGSGEVVGEVGMSGDCYLPCSNTNAAAASKTFLVGFCSHHLLIQTSIAGPSVLTLLPLSLYVFQFDPLMKPPNHC